MRYIMAGCQGWIMASALEFMGLASKKATGWYHEASASSWR